jgi:hypothetical protein
MNRTVVFVTFAMLIVLGMAGTVLLLIIAPQHFGTFTGFLIVLLGVATTAAANIWQLGKAKEALAEVKTETSAKLDVVQRQTNGTLTRLVDENARKDDTIRKQAKQIFELESALLNAVKRGKDSE